MSRYNMEQNRLASLKAWADAGKQRLHEAADSRNTPVATAAAGASGVGGGGVTAVPATLNFKVYGTETSIEFYYDRPGIDLGVSVDWGDGTAEEIQPTDTGYYYITHTYSSANEQEIIVDIKDSSSIYEMAIEELSIVDCSQLTVDDFYVYYSRITGYEIWPVAIYVGLHESYIDTLLGITGISVIYTAWCTFRNPVISALPATVRNFTIDRHRGSLTGFTAVLPAGFNYLYMRNCTGLTNFAPTAAGGGLIDIEYLYIRNCGITSFPWSSFSRIDNCNVLYNSGLNFQDNTVLPAMSYLGAPGNGFTRFMPALPLPALIDINLPANPITAFNTDCITTVTEFVSFSGCRLSTGSINAILQRADAVCRLPSGALQLTGQQPSGAPPTGAGVTAKNNLIARNWTVNTD